MSAETGLAILEIHALCWMSKKVQYVVAMVRCGDTVESSYGEVLRVVGISHSRRGARAILRHADDPNNKNYIETEHGDVTDVFLPEATHLYDLKVVFNDGWFI